MVQAGQALVAQLDPDLLKRTTYSKYLMDRAYDLRQQSSDLGAAQAILFAHDSAEMLMRVIADHQHVRFPENFLAFWEEIKRKTNIEPPHKGQMDRLNSVRVAFKHKGILPNASVVADLLPIARSFCEEATETFLGIKYDDVSLADLIPNDRARQLLKDAEAAAVAKNMAEALKALGIAFDILLRDAVAKSKAGIVGNFNLSYFSQQELGSHAQREISKAVQQLADTVNMLVLGIDPIKQKRFSLLTPVRQHTVSGDVQVIWMHDPGHVDQSAYDFCYKFVLDAGLKLSVL
jgi:hypothetical protein